MIALSADAMPEQIEIAMAAGFDQYLLKPVDLGMLTDDLNSILGTTRL